MSHFTYSWLFFVLCLQTCCSSERTLQAWENYKCGQLCSDKNVTTIYLRADSSDDTLHYFWDFYGNPSVLLAVTSKSGWIDIDWNAFLLKREKSVNFTEVPKYTFGVVITKILEFNDTHNNGLITSVDETKINILHPRYFHWHAKPYASTKDFVQLEVNGGSYRNEVTNHTRHGTVTFSLMGFATPDHSPLLPHMLHSENATQVDLIIDHLETNRSFTASRFAVELLIVSQDDPNSTMTMDTRKTLDDEHTPGVFEVVDLRTPSNVVGSYIQWRPISYVTSSRDVTSSTEVIHYPLAKPADVFNEIQNSLLSSYYGRDIRKVLVQSAKVSIGIKGDGFYDKTSYATWTFTIGYGIPPDEKFSQLVILIISIGVGLPLLIILAIGVCACLRRKPKQYTETFVN